MAARSNAISRKTGSSREVISPVANCSQDLPSVSYSSSDTFANSSTVGNRSTPATGVATSAPAITSGPRTTSGTRAPCSIAVPLLCPLSEVTITTVESKEPLASNWARIDPRLRSSQMVDATNERSRPLKPELSSQMVDREGMPQAAQYLVKLGAAVSGPAGVPNSSKSPSFRIGFTSGECGGVGFMYKKKGFPSFCAMSMNSIALSVTHSTLWVKLAQASPQLPRLLMYKPST
mmetsp:Transcript_17265/g.42325  ORF Transcript_17265/g.42325 Transcript_17265/m.42325 type:complete len:234 (-) Transcript_17265:528-1229(-)